MAGFDNPEGESETSLIALGTWQSGALTLAGFLSLPALEKPRFRRAGCKKLQTDRQADAKRAGLP